MKPKEFKGLLIFLALTLVPYVLLLGLGKHFAGGTVKSHGEQLVLMPLVEYTLSGKVIREMPESFEAQWMIDRGIPQPSGSFVYLVPDAGLLGLANTRENHALFEAWLNEAYGPENWRYNCESTLDLCFPIGDRYFGLEGIRWWEFEGPHNTLPTYYSGTEISFGRNGGGATIVDFASADLWVTTQGVTSGLPGAVTLYVLIFFAAWLLFILRRPLKRALAGLRRNRPPPDQPTT